MVSERRKGTSRGRPTSSWRLFKSKLYRYFYFHFFSLICVSYLIWFEAAGFDSAFYVSLILVTFFFFNNFNFLSEPLDSSTECPPTKSSRTELSGTERNHLIMQNFAKAIWQVLKQYRDKLKVIIYINLTSFESIISPLYCFLSFSLYGKHQFSISWT